MALKEDVGTGDVTSEATVPADRKGEGRIFSREEGVLCGLTVAREILRQVDPKARLRTKMSDGEPMAPGLTIATVHGSLRSILTAERLMLNFLQQLSGVATLTRRHVDGLRAAGSKMDVVDTRKTTPLWRVLQRHAVRCGGGVNHRFALYDMYLVKNNHIDAAGGVEAALAGVRAKNRNHRLTVAVEARTLDEVRRIMAAGADLVLLDNMSPSQMRRAVEIIDGRARTEITGGVTLRRIPTLASLPVDRVSIGALTHSAPALDVALHVS